MPITLPEGITPKIRSLTDDQVLVDSVRETEWRWELLDQDETLIGTLDGVQPGGSADWSASSSVKASGRVTVQATGQDVDWLNVRLRPVCVIKRLSREVPVGVWIPSSDGWDGSDLGVTFEVELLDKSSRLDGDIWFHPTTGMPATYVATKGSNVLALVRDLITQTGEKTPAIDVTGGPALTKDRSWEANTSRLKIINDLLDSAGYFSLWVDHAGQFQCTKYTSPADRPPIYAAVAPFVAGPTSIMSPDVRVDRNIFAVPNRYVCFSQGDGTNAGLTSVATNTNPDSPFSYLRRGNKWFTRVDDAVDAIDQATLDLLTRRKLEAATAVTSKIKFEHLFLPDLLINSTIQARNENASIDQLCTVSNTTVVFDELAMCSSTLQEVTL